ncbi:MAG: RIP metalloprotease RseP [Gammaproteobacteria bacterium]|nr:RIP metalloprotease RseP [Gammaproteobacteria bacterium]
MLNIFMSIIGIIITILLVVGIHEMGHFLVAKACGIKVLRFSIGFGKALFTWHDKKGTEYVLAAIPLGGYVKMLDEGEEAVLPEEAHLAFNRQPYYKKMAVIAAGPISNLIFAFVIYWILFTVGFITIAPIIGKVAPNSIAASANLKPEQEILAIDNKPTHNWTTVIINLLTRAGDNGNLNLEIKNPTIAESQHYQVSLVNWHLDDLKPDPLDSLGISPYEPFIPAIIGKVIPNSPAAKSGMQQSDEIIAIDNKPVKDYLEMVNIINEHPGATLSFSIKRQNKIMTLPITIGVKRNLFFQKFGFLGVASNFEWPKSMLRINQYGPIEAMSHAFRDVETFTKLNLIILGKMVTGKISLKSLGGPITIFESAGTALNNGIISFLSFLAFLSISIGIVNILPVPGLDGGHLLFQTIEAIIRRPLSSKSQVLFFRLGLIFLLLVMFQALVNDILRL